MEYQVISLDGHLFKYYALVYKYTGYMLKLSFLLFQSLMNSIEFELFQLSE